jgi:hypothetical protein
MNCRIADGWEGDELWADEIVETANLVEVAASRAIGGSRHGRSAGVLKLEGAVVKRKVGKSGRRYVIKSEDGADVGEVFPDFKLDPSQREVDCMAILEVRDVVKGLVLSLVSDGQGGAVYSRCGCFAGQLRERPRTSYTHSL